MVVYIHIIYIYLYTRYVYIVKVMYAPTMLVTRWPKGYIYVISLLNFTREIHNFGVPLVEFETPK